MEAKGAAQEASGDATSFDSGISSTIGVLGDLGLFGVVVYGVCAVVTLRLRRETTPEGTAAAAGFALFLVLGLVFDWWEQPPYGVVIGVLAGLALTERAKRVGASPIAMNSQATWASQRALPVLWRRLRWKLHWAVRPNELFVVDPWWDGMTLVLPRSGSAATASTERFPPRRSPDGWRSCCTQV